MINLYRSPDDLWVAGPLLRWGVIVLLHFLGAVITWAFTTAFDAAEATRREAAPATGPYPRSRQTPYPYPQQPPYPQSQAAVAARAASPRPRFSPSRSTPATTIEVEERRPPVKSASPPAAPTEAKHRASPPGWTVVRGETADPSPPAVDPAPIAEVDSASSDSVEDARWTWVEAAAEAWLSGRTDKADTNPSNDDSNGDSTTK